MCSVWKKKDKTTSKFKVKVQLALLASHAVVLFLLSKCHSWDQCKQPEGLMGWGQWVVRKILRMWQVWPRSAAIGCLKGRVSTCWQRAMAEADKPSVRILVWTPDEREMVLRTCPGASWGRSTENLWAMPVPCDGKGWQILNMEPGWSSGSRQYHTGSQLEHKLIYSPLQSLSSFTNNNKFKIGLAGLRTGCPSWWCSSVDIQPCGLRPMWQAEDTTRAPTI
jgi:hypothetical protein